MKYDKRSEYKATGAAKTPNGWITSANIKKAEQILTDNGIDPDEAITVLQALGYALLDVELYPDN